MFENNLLWSCLDSHFSFFHAKVDYTDTPKHDAPNVLGYYGLDEHFLY